MNNRKLKQLFGAARSEQPPTPPEGFDGQVMRQIQQETLRPTRSALSLVEQLNLLFPKLAWAAAVLIVLCVASEFILASQGPDLAEGMVEVSEDWLFGSDAF